MLKQGHILYNPAALLELPRLEKRLAQSPTKQQAMDYLIQELPSVMDNSIDSRVSFNTAEDGILWFRIKWFTPGETEQKTTAFPIDSISVDITTFGSDYMLMARKLPNGVHNIEFFKSSFYEKAFEQTPIARMGYLPKLQKIEKAFKHLITLETGKTDLFYQRVPMVGDSLIEGNIELIEP